MANATQISFCNYGWETTFATETTSYNKVFGHGVKLSSLSRKNNIEPIHSLGYRNAQLLTPKQYEGTFSVDFTLANPWWLKAVFGSDAATTGSGSYYHTYSESNTLASFSIQDNISTDTKSIQTLRGCKVNQATISTAINELASVKLDGQFANEDEDSTTGTQVAETFALFTYAQASLELPNGTTMADVQNCEIVINNNNEYMWGLGSRFATQAVPKNRAYSTKFSLAFEDASKVLENFYGSATGPAAIPAEIATMEFLFTNSLTSTSTRSVSFMFTGVQLDTHDLPQDPTAVFMEDVAGMMRSCTVTATDATQTAL